MSAALLGSMSLLKGGALVELCGRWPPKPAAALTQMPWTARLMKSGRSATPIQASLTFESVSVVTQQGDSLEAPLHILTNLDTL